MIKFEWNGVVFLMTDLGGGKLGQSIPPHAHAKGCYELHFVTGGKGILITDDKEIHLMPIEYNLLCLLAKNIGRVLTHQYILDKVWVNSIESDLSSLRVYVTSLRKKIEKISNEKYIQTHVGVGYKMIKIDNSDIEEKNNESSKY